MYVHFGYDPVYGTLCYKTSAGNWYPATMEGGIRAEIARREMAKRWPLFSPTMKREVMRNRRKYCPRPYGIRKEPTTYFRVYRRLR